MPHAGVGPAPPCAFSKPCKILFARPVYRSPIWSFRIRKCRALAVVFSRIGYSSAGRSKRDFLVAKKAGDDSDHRGRCLGHDGMHLENLDCQNHDPNTHHHEKSIDHVKSEVFPEPITPGPEHEKLVTQISIGNGNDIAGDQQNEIIHIIFQPEIRQGIKTNTKDSIPSADRQIDRHLPPTVLLTVPEDVV